MTRIFTTLALVLAVLVAGPADDAVAGKKEAQETVDKATETIGRFALDPDLSAFRDYAKEAKGLLIVPTMVKAGFIIGGSIGGGVLVARGDKDEWSHPAFYTMGSVTFGLQIGGEVSEIVLLVMSDKGLESLMTASAKLGADVGIAAGPTGAGAKAVTSDIVAFGRSKGLYAGINVEGAVLDTQDGENKAYYGSAVKPRDIVLERKVSNDAAQALRDAVAKLGKAE